jgi:hypothetical protein
MPVALALMLACCVAREPVMNGDYVAVQTQDGAKRWHLAPLPKGNGTFLFLRLVQAESTNAQVFVIEVVGANRGRGDAVGRARALTSGSQVRLRGVNSSYFNGRDPWLFVEGGSPLVNMTDMHPELGMADPTILTIENFDGSPGVITYGAPFKIRGATDARYLTESDSRDDAIGVFAQAYGAFVFAPPNREMMKDDVGISEHSPSRTPGALMDLFNIFFPNHQRDPVEPAAKRDDSARKDDPPSTGGEPTFRVEQPGSTIRVFVANASNRAYTCTVSIAYEWIDFGTLKRGTDSHTEIVQANTADRSFFSLLYNYPQMKLSRPLARSCQ